MAAFDPIAAGGVPFDPNVAGGTPVDARGFGSVTPKPGAPGMIPGGGIVSGNPPGFDATTGAAAAQQTAMTGRAQTYANDMFPLFRAQQELATAPTGKGSELGYDAGALMQTNTPEWLHRLVSYTTTLGHTIGGIMSPEQTAAYAEANKYLTQAALGVAGATRSNEGGQTAAAASPSVLIPKPAAQAVLQGMIGLRRMEQDQTMQWQQSGKSVQELPAFVSRFQTNADPRVYVWDQLPAAQRGQILGKMSPAQQGEFITKVNQAKANGLYNTMGMSPQPQ